MSEKKDNLFGKLTGHDFDMVATAYRDLWNEDKGEEKLNITMVSGHMVRDWNNDEDGGPGLCLFLDFESPSGKTSYQSQIIIPKDELIKALRLMVE